MCVRLRVILDMCTGKRKLVIVMLFMHAFISSAHKRVDVLESVLYESMRGDGENDMWEASDWMGWSVSPFLSISVNCAGTSLLDCVDYAP